jgi:hypothetical protein
MAFSSAATFFVIWLAAQFYAVAAGCGIGKPKNQKSIPQGLKPALMERRMRPD